MSLSKWLQHDNGPQNRLHMSPLLQSDEEEREDSTMTITSTHSGHVLRRASLVRQGSGPSWTHEPASITPDGTKSHAHVVLPAHNPVQLTVTLHAEDEAEYFAGQSRAERRGIHAYLAHPVEVLTLPVMLQTEDMFRDPDAPVPEGQRPDGELQRLVIERNLSSDQFEAPNLRSATNGEAEGTQMTINAPSSFGPPGSRKGQPHGQIP